MAAAVIAVMMLDLRSIVEHQAASRSGRSAHIGGLSVHWASPIVLRISEFRLGNTVGGQAPDYVRFTSLMVEIEPWPLLRGELRLRRLVLDRPVIALERDGNHIGNWKLHPGADAGPEPPRRAELPYMADLALRDGEITYRTSNGAILHIRLKDMRLTAPAVDAPATIVADGSYNDVALRMDLRTQPYAVLWQTSVPFGFSLEIRTADTELAFHGTATAPLDFDGLDGELRIVSARLDDWMSIFGAPDAIPIRIRLGGKFEKNADHWRLPQAAGQLAGSDFSGLLALDEGASGNPDHFTFRLGFAPMDIRHLVELATAPPGTTTRPTYLHVEEHPGETYDVHIDARQARYGDIRLGDLRLAAALAPARLTVSELAMRVAGGEFRATASAVPAGRGSRTVLDASLAGADASALLGLVGSDAATLSGRLEAAATIAMTGDTVDDALRASNGQVVVGITQGRISRSLVEQASINLGQLFGGGSGSTALLCLLGVASLRDGLLSVAPVRLRTPDGNLFAGGTLDLLNRRIDLEVKGEAKSTGFWALDLPVRISGKLANPQTGLSRSFSEAGMAARASVNLSRLTPALRRVVNVNRCFDRQP